jgi:hypothetical protein
MYQWCCESASGSVCFWPPGSADPDPLLDKYQNVTNPQHWNLPKIGNIYW